MIKWPTGKGDLRRRLWKLVHPTQRDQQRIQMPEPYADCTAVLKFIPIGGFQNHGGIPSSLESFFHGKSDNSEGMNRATPILRNHTKPPNTRKKTPGSRTNSFQAGWKMSPSRCRAVGFLETSRGLWGENWALRGPRFNRPCLKMWENAWSPTEESSSVPFQNP